MISAARVASYGILAIAVTLTVSCSSSSEPGPETTDPGTETVTQDSSIPTMDAVQEIVDTDPGLDLPQESTDLDANHDSEEVAPGDAVPDLDVPANDMNGTSTSWGSIQGSCGGLAAELGLTTPSFYANEYIFGNGASFDPDALAPGPKQRFDGPNAGGSSKCSEVMSMQLLIDCEGASIYKTEVEIEYTTEGAMTDYIALIGDQKVGVSVTRAYLGPFVQDYTLADATELLTKKLEAVQESTSNVSHSDLWVKQILHIWTLHSEWATTVQQAWDTLGPAIKSDTIVLITVEGQSDLIVTDACDD
jgi:hypothetical protein